MEAGGARGAGGAGKRMTARLGDVVGALESAYPPALAESWDAVGLVCGDLVATFRTGAFDLVVANLPYVPDGDLAGLAPEVRDHEPRSALAGGADGLGVVRALVVVAARVLAPGGWLVVEIGAGQASRVAEMADDGWWARPERSPGAPR